MKSSQQSKNIMDYMESAMTWLDNKFTKSGSSLIIFAAVCLYFIIIAAGLNFLVGIIN